jgi:hypothetical protein
VFAAISATGTSGRVRALAPLGEQQTAVDGTSLVRKLVRGGRLMFTGARRSARVRKPRKQRIRLGYRRRTQPSQRHRGYSGGYEDHATASWAAVGGGGNNLASGERASVSGGFINTAKGTYSSILGGKELKAELEYQHLP